jgi:hypothetical protein
MSQTEQAERKNQTKEGQRMIPEGNYLARAMSMAAGESSQKKSPGITVVFSITQDCPQKGQIMEWTGWLSEAAKARTAESLVLCGFDGHDPETVKKNEVLLVVEHEDVPPDPNNPNAPPRKRARISWINDPARGGGGMVPVDGAKQAQVFSDLRGLIFAKKEEMAKKAAASGDAGSFNYGANANGAPQGAPPPAQQPPPAQAKAPPKF